MIFTTGTITLKYGKKDLEKSSIVMLIISPIKETIAPNKIIKRSYNFFLSIFILNFILQKNKIK